MLQGKAPMIKSADLTIKSADPSIMTIKSADWTNRQIYSPTIKTADDLLPQD